MAKKSQVFRDRRRQALVDKYAAKRKELRDKLRDHGTSIEEKLEAQKEFAKLPRNSCRTRITTRCELTGRARATTASSASRAS